ncbi:MAG: hypothetical protein LBL65_05780 [Campylobacteraceae bacterium]|jgi:hypothetical protein|nr:hypothetical protein [Campylobacteraceae bacterium]
MKKFQTVLFACLFILFVGCGGGGSDEGDNGGGNNLNSGFPTLDNVFPAFNHANQTWITKRIGYGNVTADYMEEYRDQLMSLGFGCGGGSLTYIQCYKLPPIEDNVNPYAVFNEINSQIYDFTLRLSKDIDFSVSLFNRIFPAVNLTPLLHGLEKRYSINIAADLESYINDIGFILSSTEYYAGGTYTKTYIKRMNSNVYIFRHTADISYSTAYWEIYDAAYYDAYIR